MFSFFKLVWWKAFNQNFKSPYKKKIKKTLTTNEWVWNVSVVSFRFGVLASLIFVVDSATLFFTRTNNLSKHSSVVLAQVFSCEFLQFFKKPLQNTPRWLLLLIPLFQVLVNDHFFVFFLHFFYFNYWLQSSEFLQKGYKNDF